MLAVASVSFNADAKMPALQRAYLSKRGNVHVVTTNGRDMQLTSKGHNDRVQLAGNKKTVAWISNPLKDESSLKFYYEGKIRTVQGGPFVRDFWFVDDGSKIGVDIGGLHFAGTEILYDVVSGRRLEEVKQRELPYDKRPPWSR